VTTWDSEESFQEWSANGAEAAHAAPAGGGHGGGASGGESAGEGARRPVATGADLLEFEVVEL
jgi:heme-degrading monooxygenase HmoA